MTILTNGMWCWKEILDLWEVSMAERSNNPDLLSRRKPQPSLDWKYFKNWGKMKHVDILLVWTHTHSKTVFSLHKLLNGFFERESAISECQKCHFFPPFKLEKVEIFDRQVRVIFIRCKTEKLSPFVQLFIHVCFLASISEYMVCTKGYVYAWSKYLKR